MKAIAVIRRAHFSKTLILSNSDPTYFVPMAITTAKAPTGKAVPIPKTVEGMDLSEALLGKENAPEQEAVLTMNFSNAYGYLKEGRQWRGIRTQTDSYTRHYDGRIELFDLEKDPLQMDNLALGNASNQRIKELEKILQKKLKERGDTFCECGTLRHWFDSERRVVANAFGPLPHPETAPDWANLAETE